MASRRPNILLITSDQQHYSTLGAVNPRIRTPALDRLGREGVRFDRAYCPNPTCTPARASIITGMYPSQHGAWSLGTKLFEDVPTVGDLFAKAGYATGLIGKAHFQPLASRAGLEAIVANPVVMRKTVVPGWFIVVYKGLGPRAKEIIFNAANNQIPQLRAADQDQPQYIDYPAPATFDSPFIHSEYNSGIVTIRDGDQTITLDFTQ